MWWYHNVKENSKRLTAKNHILRRQKTETLKTKGIVRESLQTTWLKGLWTNPRDAASDNNQCTE
jgi:hypothetical protein